MKLTPFETTMLTAWEDVYRKSQVSLWILVAIREGKGFVEDIRVFISTYGDIEMSEQSLYRSLRRLESSTLLDTKTIANPKGPDKKYFELSPEGSRVLAHFIERNITSKFIDTNLRDVFARPRKET